MARQGWKRTAGRVGGHPGAGQDAVEAFTMGRVPMDRAKSSEEALARKQEDARPASQRSKFEVWGEEMIEKEVRQSGNSGRVYLPPSWIGSHVKIIRID